jgi:hypothetical protein
VQAPDAPEVPPNNPTPPANEENYDVMAVNGANCEICVGGNQKTHVFILFGHCVCRECADNIVIWFGTDARYPNESKCCFVFLFFFSRTCGERSS